MTDSAGNPRIELFRKAAVLQLKLLADGFRDALLIPVSFVAALIGLTRGGDDCEREFQRVLELGRRSERWINLFEAADRVPEPAPEGVRFPDDDIDTLVRKMESYVVDEYKKGGVTRQARDHLDQLLRTVRRNRRDGGNSP